MGNRTQSIQGPAFFTLETGTAFMTPSIREFNNKDSMFVMFGQGGGVERDIPSVPPKKYPVVNNTKQYMNVY